MKPTNNNRWLAAAGALLMLLTGAGCAKKHAYDPNVVDEAKAAGETAADYPTDPYNNFPGMDNEDRLASPLTEDEIKGRNSWVMWTGGNQAFWDHLARHGYGVVDLLKLIDNRHMARAKRLARAGLINEPGFKAPTEPDEFGLHLDVRDGPEPEHLPDYRVYGYSTGVMGLRYWRNPAFDEAAQAKWDPEKWMTDPNYYDDPELVRPFRVGMSCGFCHIAFNPLKPPADPAEPKWENLASNQGSQYFRFGEVFGIDKADDDLVWHLVNYPRPGSLDTSLVATDGNNNPNTMNSLYNILARIEISKKVPTEHISGDSLNMGVLQGLGLKEGPDRNAPRVLAGGADSIGALGALARVYVNIGEFHQEWLQDMNLMVGFIPQRPFTIEKAQKDSVFWQVSEYRAHNMAKFFVKTTGPLHLKDAEGFKPEYIDETLVGRGAEVFARECFVCHSSKQPDGFWDNPTDWERYKEDPDYRAFALAEVRKPDFRENNYLSTDQRYPVTDIKTNAARSVADNAKAGRIWESFSSDDFKSQPILTDPITVHHPYTGEASEWRLSDKVGPGRYRPHTLTSIWSTAPFLHNNTVGDYSKGNDPRKGQQVDPSVAGRLATFDDSIRKMLWPEQRAGFDSVYRTPKVTSATLPSVVVADAIHMQLGIPAWLLRTLLALLILVGLVIFLKGARRAKEGTGSGLRNVAAILIGLFLVIGVWTLWRKDFYEVGHIPQGTPINLLLNLNGPGHLDLKDRDTRKTAKAVLRDLVKVSKKELPSLAHDEVPDLVPNLLKLNKCPDFVLDKGHYFGAAYRDYELDLEDGGYKGVPGTETDTSDEDRRALIEFLKTL